MDREVAILAAAQHGVFARAQLVHLGASRSHIQWRLETARWERAAPGVFRLGGVPPSWRQSLMTACLVWGEGSAVSHRAAAPLLRLARLGREIVELTVPRTRQRKGPGIVHRNLLPEVDVTVVDAIPVTTPARTLIDLASVAPPEVVEEALDDALRRGLVSVPRIRWRLSELGRRGRPGILAMRALLEAREGIGAVPQSVFETRLLRALRRAKLSEPILQHPVRDGGRVVAVVDFAYPEVRLAIETDGYRWHSGRIRWENDLARRNELTLLGWRIVHVTWSELTENPDAVTDAIARSLAPGR